MHHRFRAVLLMVAFAVAFVMNGMSAPSVHAEPVTIALSNESTFYQPLARFLKHAQDDALELDIDDIRAGALAFEPVTTPYADFGLGPARHWLWAKLHNDGGEGGRWRVDIRRQYMQELAIYAVRADGGVETLLTHTDKHVFGDRQIYSRFLQADIDVAADETVDIYIAYRSTSVSYLPPAVGTIDGVAASHSGEFVIDALFNGGLLAMFLLTLLWLPIIGWKLSLSFSAYISAGALFVLHADSYTFQYFWPNSPQINDSANLGFMLLMPAFALAFARTLFEIPQQFPMWDKVIITFIVAAGSLSVLSPTYVHIPAIMTFAYAVVPVGTLIQLFTGILMARSRLIGSTPYLLGAIGVAISFGYAVIAHVQPGYWSMDRTLDVGHASILAECFAFASAIVLRMVAIRDERDSALRAELAESQKRLSTEKALRRSQADFALANKLSETRLNQLASVSHDLRAPLATLRRVLGQIGSESEAGTGRMFAAIDYLESLARLETSKATIKTMDMQADASETFAVRVILDNVSELYAEQAHAKGIAYRTVVSDQMIAAHPVVLMRVISNLAINAIKHGGPTKLLVGCRRRGCGLDIEIWDNGIGMDDAELVVALRRGGKGEGSDGAGLGLAIVAEQCAESGLGFDICSEKSSGTRATISVPLAATDEK